MDNLSQKRWKLVHYICDFISTWQCRDDCACCECTQSHLDDVWFKKEVTNDEDDKR